MKFSTGIIATMLAALAVSTQALPCESPAPTTPNTPTGGLASVVPPTLVVPGNPNCAGDSIGPIRGIRIPCRCPPSDAEIAAKLQQDFPDVPVGLDLDSTLQRFQLTLATVQNLKCPGAATQIKGKLDKLGELKASGGASNEQVAAAIAPTQALFTPVLVGGAGPGFDGQPSQ
ncbi:hypothetical protein BC832DRAFT_566785 [Gaertneriomyces semiglobifer]|nr:hypothetical protein BC832DRAFT_566785 [Gaertneriomyces semiglobifer]